MSVPEILGRVPQEFDFYHALRLVECHFRGLPRIGTSVRPGEDPVRLGQDPEMVFAGSTISSFTPGREGGGPRLGVSFLGLFGPQGPLPLHLTEYARDRVRHAGDRTLVGFADLFHHRLLSLFYRARSAAEPTFEGDRPQEDGFARRLASLCGLGFDSLRDRDECPDQVKLHFAGRLAAGPKNPDGLSALLSCVLQSAVLIEEFVGHWLRLPKSCQCRLGESIETGVLGESVMLGERVWDRQNRFDLSVGPVSFQKFLEFLPGGKSLNGTVAVVRNYLGDEFAWTLRVVLTGSEVPPIRLGESGRLGWTSWLYTSPPEHDVSDLFLHPVPDSTETD